MRSPPDSDVGRALAASPKVSRQEMIDFFVGRAPTHPPMKRCGQTDTHKSHYWYELVAGETLTRVCKGAPQ